MRASIMPIHLVSSSENVRSRSNTSPTRAGARGTETELRQGVVGQERSGKRTRAARSRIVGKPITQVILEPPLCSKHLTDADDGQCRAAAPAPTPASLRASPALIPDIVIFTKGRGLGGWHCEKQGWREPHVRPPRDEVACLTTAAVRDVIDTANACMTHTQHANYTCLGTARSMTFVSAASCSARHSHQPYSTHNLLLLASCSGWVRLN